MKAAIITGATSDIGFEVIQKLLQRDYVIYAIGRNDGRLIELGQLSHQITCIHADLSDEREVSALCNRLNTTIEKIDLLLHCAGIWHGQDKVFAGIELQNFTSKEIQDTLSVGLTSFLLLLRTLLPKLSPNAHVIGISGTFENGGKGWIPYYVSKRGLEDTLIALADEVKERDVYVNGISPSDTATTPYKKFFPQYIDESITPEAVAKTCMEILDSKRTGEILVVKYGHQPHNQFHA